jgi:Predicted solute binding protein
MMLIRLLLLLATFASPIVQANNIDHGTYRTFLAASRACQSVIPNNACGNNTTLPGVQSYEYLAGSVTQYYSQIPQTTGITFVAWHRWLVSSSCPSGYQFNANDLCVASCPPAGSTQQLSFRTTISGPRTPLGTFNFGGCEATVSGVGVCLFVAGGAPDELTCTSTLAYTGQSAPAGTPGADVTFTADPPPPTIDPPHDTRQTNENTTNEPPQVTTQPDGTATTQTESTRTETTTGGTSSTQSGGRTDLNQHDPFVNTTTTNTTTTTQPDGSVNSTRQTTNTRQGGGTTTVTVTGGNITTTTTPGQDNTTTTTTTTAIDPNGRTNTNTTGGDCVGQGCGEGDQMGICDLAPVLCRAAEFILAPAEQPAHPDLPVLDAAQLPQGTFQAPTGACLVDPVVNVFGNAVRLPFSETVCVFCDLMRPILIIVASFIAIGILLGARSND